MDLTQRMRQLLADAFVFYVTAHIAHWNVQGPLFPMLHAFFGEIYEDVWGSLDGIAERIRTSTPDLAPTTLADLVAPSHIQTGDMSAAGMLQQLRDANEQVIVSLNMACATATQAGKAGLVDFLQSRLDQHAKWAWQLRMTRL